MVQSPEMGRLEEEFGEEWRVTVSVLDKLTLRYQYVGGDVKQTAGRSQARDIDLGVISL